MGTIALDIPETYIRSCQVFSYDRDTEEKLNRVRRKKQKWGTTFFGKLYLNVTISCSLQETRINKNSTFQFVV